MTLLRSIQHSEVLGAIEAEKVLGKPKPTKLTRKKLVKSPILPPKPDKPKRKKKTTRQKLMIALDGIVREIVFARDAQAAPLVYKGEMKHSGIDQPGHIISRGKISVRWDLRNVHKQDANDNNLHEYYPEIYTQWYINNFGADSWNELVEDSKVISNYSIAELETLLFNLTEIQKNGQGCYHKQKFMVQEDFCQKYGYGSFSL